MYRIRFAVEKGSTRLPILGKHLELNKDRVWSWKKKKKNAYPIAKLHSTAILQYANHCSAVNCPQGLNLNGIRSQNMDVFGAEEDEMARKLRYHNGFSTSVKVGWEGDMFDGRDVIWGGGHAVRTISTELDSKSAPLNNPRLFTVGRALALHESSLWEKGGDVCDQDTTFGCCVGYEYILLGCGCSC